VFRVTDPQVEAELTASLADLLLRHMATEPVPSVATTPPPRAPERDRVAADEIDAFVEAVSGRTTVPAPSLTAGLDVERLWILADLANSGTGLCRMRATAELRAAIERLDELDRIEPDLLATMVERIRAARRHGEVSVLMHVLLLAASESLERRNRPARRAR
jgi:hypothetical protein